MRFRLATSGAESGGQQLAGGIGNLFRSISMAPAVAAQAAQEAQQLQGQMDLQKAQTALFRNKSAEIDDQRDRSSLGSMLKTAQMVNGVPMAEQADFGAFLQTGQMPGRYEPPVDGVGPRMPVPKFYQDDTAQRILQTLGLTNTALTVGDSNSLNIAKGAGEYQDQRITDQAVALAAKGDDMGMSRLNAIRGKKEFTPFAAVGTTGTALNQVTGTQDVANAGLRALFGNKTAAEIEADKARAGASRASAASSYASAAKSRADMERDVRSGDLSVVTGPDGTVNIVNKRDRTAQQVTGPNGLPLVKGSSGGANKTMTEGQAKANLFGTRMVEANKIFDDLTTQGVTTVNQVKRAADAVPLVGAGLGMLANSTVVSPGQQRLEQAQRDFINAVLRRESGAVIADSEFASAAQQYFTQPGDAPEVIAQKKKNRERAAQLLLLEVPASVREQSAAIDAPPTGSRAGGASSGWGAAPAPAAGGWSIQRVE
ncbi:hypothetical protein [Hydrogenophaga sp.]